MSTSNNDLDAKLAEAKATANQLLKRQSGEDSAVEVAKTRSTKDIVLWIIAAALLISATLVNQYLPGYWHAANNLWVRIGIIVLVVVLAIIALALTNQGRAFKTLLGDAGIELRRVTWPSKPETILNTWQVLLVIAIAAVIIWLLDNFFNWFVSLFLG